jgi:CO/xanthine dehydrogenase Mo-binding subunit
MTMHDDHHGAVGRAVPVVDGRAKAAGSLAFLQDIAISGMLHARMVLAGRPHARITDLSLAPITALDRVECVATADDVPGENRVGVVIDDQPLFASDRVRYEGDCLAVVGALDPQTAAEAVSLVNPRFEDLSPVLTLDHARMGGAPSIHEGGNLAVEKILKNGSIEDGEAASKFFVEQTFRTPVQEHAYLEPLGAMAIPHGDGSIEILAPAQCPFYIRDAVARCLGLPLSKVRVIQLPMGGAFGGKEDVPSEVCARLAVLARKARRPVRMILSREEDMVYTSKRHPTVLRYRMGCDGGGHLTFADITIDADVGAYATLSPIVLFRSTVHASGPYRIPNVSVVTRGYYTNTAPKGAFRGFGTPQVAFACEAVIDELAAKAGSDPLAFRLANALEPGSSTATGQVLEDSVGFVATLERAGALLGQAEDRFKPRIPAPGLVAARGVASMIYGVSLGAAGRVLDRGAAKVEVLKDCSVSVFVGCTDMGQGALTVLSQIAADALGVPLATVAVNRVDTDVVPDSGPTVASRTTVVSGNAIIDACRKIVGRLSEAARGLLGEDAAYDPAAGMAAAPGSQRRIGFRELVAACFERRIGLAATGWYAVPECRLDADTHQGKAYYVYCFATDIADVLVDTATGKVEVTSFKAVHDSGRIVNRLTAVGQVEGGIAQGLGLALYERYLQTEGRLSTTDLSTYLLPTALDVCDDIEVEFVEALSSDGPFGAKGLGEPAIIPVPAAVANAVSNALGIRVTELPIDRELLIGGSETPAPPKSA